MDGLAWNLPNMKIQKKKKWIVNLVLFISFFSQILCSYFHNKCHFLHMNQYENETHEIQFEMLYDKNQNDCKICKITKWYNPVHYATKSVFRVWEEVKRLVKKNASLTIFKTVYKITPEVEGNLWLYLSKLAPNIQEIYTCLPLLTRIKIVALTAYKKIENCQYLKIIVVI